jgi:hypothetical protein
MENDRLAAQIEAMRDQAEAWGPPRRKRKSERRQRNALVSVRFSVSELASVQARAAGGPLSGYLRDLALAAVHPPLATPVWAAPATVNAAGTNERYIVRDPVQATVTAC